MSRLWRSNLHSSAHFLIRQDLPQFASSFDQEVLPKSIKIDWSRRRTKRIWHSGPECQIENHTSIDWGGVGNAGSVWWSPLFERTHVVRHNLESGCGWDMFARYSVSRKFGCRVQGFGMVPGPLWMALWVVWQLYRCILQLQRASGGFRSTRTLLGGKASWRDVSESCGLSLWVRSFVVFSHGGYFWASTVFLHLVI